MNRIDAYEQRIELEEDVESTVQLTGLSFDLSRLKIQKESEAVRRKTLIAEIYTAFKARKSDYWAIRALVEGKGCNAAEGHFREIQSSLKDPRCSIRNPLGLWTSRMKDEVVIFDQGDIMKVSPPNEPRPQAL